MLALAYGGYSPVKAEGKNYSDYVNPLMGTLSEHQLSTGNTYPAIARPWGTSGCLRLEKWVTDGPMYMITIGCGGLSKPTSPVLGSMTTGCLPSCR